jgi:DNA-binding NarL/FixJ family response regulator
MIKVAVIEDHKVLVDALALMMGTEDDLQFIGAANSYQEAQALMRASQPDVLLLDVGLPDGDGLDLVPLVKEHSPQAQIVVLTSMANEKIIMRAIDSGVSGFMSKGESLPRLLSTIRKAAQGEIIMPTELLVDILKRLPSRQESAHNNQAPWERLTSREVEILNHLARGETGDEIASQLNISPLTVRTHIRNMMAKLVVHSRLEAVSFGLQHGLIRGFEAK